MPFDAFMEGTLESIELQVLPLIATGSAEGSRRGEVTVSVFDDVAMARTPVAAPVTAWSDPAGWTAWVPTMGLVVLALMAVGAMLLMLRRVGIGTTVLQDGAEVVEHSMLAEDVDVLGEVDDTDIVLDGIEIDNEEVRRRVMLDQIRDAVQAHPEESASVLRRWTRTET